MTTAAPRTRGLPPLRGAAPVVAAALCVPMVVLMGAGTADAASYRFWSYWQAPAGSGWAFSPQGPASTLPRDGDVEGWRFAISADAGSATNTPRAAASFSRICAGVDREPEKKRIALVVDYGIGAHAPSGETPPALETYCVLVSESTRGVGVLLNAVDVRSKDGLVCGINGYPRTECAVVVKDAPAPAAPAPPPVQPKTPASPPASDGSRDSATDTRVSGSGAGVTARSNPQQSDATDEASGPSTVPTQAPSSDAPTESAEADQPNDASSATPNDAALLDPTPVLVDGPSSSPRGAPTAVLATGLLIAGLGALTWWKRRSA